MTSWLRLKGAGSNPVLAVKLICESLVPDGHRVICTSRPESSGGVRLDEFDQNFLILDLKPLDDDQQRKAVYNQLQGFPAGMEFAKHLTDFASIRKGHNELYARLFDEVCQTRIEADRSRSNLIEAFLRSITL